jgi:hypothetical protein
LIHLKKLTALKKQVPLSFAKTGSLETNIQSKQLCEKRWRFFLAGSTLDQFVAALLEHGTVRKRRFHPLAIFL